MIFFIESILIIDKWLIKRSEMLATYLLHFHHTFTRQKLSNKDRKY